MKHLFWTHSHTAFYTSLATIKYLGLNPDEVVFISDRGYGNKYFDFDYHDFSDLVNKLSPFTIKTALTLGKIKNDFDHRIDSIIGENKFIAYIPHLTHPAFQTLITHHSCRGFNFIEEGLANYINDNYEGSSFRSFSKATNILIKLYNQFSNRTVLNHMVFGLYKKSKYVPKYYLVNNKYHNKRDNQVMLTWERHKLDINIFPNSIILILGPTLEYKMATPKYYKKVMQKLIDFSKDKSSSFYVKFHPYSSNYTIQLIEELLINSNIQYEKIEQDEPIEQVFLSNNKLNVIGIDSSLLFYAKVLNHSTQIVSVYKKLLSNDNLYKEKCSISKIETIFDEGIVLL